MESVKTVSAAEEAKTLINRNVEEAEKEGVNSPDRLKQKISAGMQHVFGETRHHVDIYLNGMKSATEGMQVEDLDDGIGGLYDGSKPKMATDTLEVSSTVEGTVERMEEVSDHEHYHQDNDHLAPMKTAATKDDPNVLVLGGQKFTTDVPLVEGLTVHDTGNRFVSAEYKQMEQDLLDGASAAGIGMDTLRTAINEQKDLTLIDDRTRKNSDAEIPVFSLA